MIVDDSIVARAVLTRMLEAEPDIRVVAQAGNGAGALALLEREPVDAILLDLEMPGQSGLEALPALLEKSGDAPVLIVSGACQRGATASIEAMRLGAADTLLKPGVAGLGDAFAEALVDRLRRIAARPRRQRSVTPHLLQAPAATRQALDCLAIGASTGGVHALAAFFAAFPREAQVPILVTQHLPAPFMAPFARQLADLSGRTTRIAEDGMALLPDTILLAPGDAHLAVVRTGTRVHVRLERGRVPSGCTPSVDPMFASIAHVFGRRACAVVLSGMGRDGLMGAQALAEAGGEIVVQDSGSSVVWGMPGVVAQAGIACAVLPPALLAERVGARAWK